MTNPVTWWLTGLPCSGKTTLANAMAIRLRHQGQAVCVLDGDVLRAGVASDLSFSPADREEQARHAMNSLLNAETFAFDSKDTMIIP
jgi:adenylylsulfate kinase-like enzyme